MAVTDEKIAQSVAHYRGLLDALPQLPESLSGAPDSRLHVIIERAGGKRRGEAFLARLDQAFTDGGITTHPSLTAPDLEPDDRVYMFDAKHPIEHLTPTRQLFDEEKTLQSFILANQHQSMRRLSDGGVGACTGWGSAVGSLGARAAGGCCGLLLVVPGPVGAFGVRCARSDAG